MDKAIDRMRDMIESGSSKEKLREEGDEFAKNLAEEILNTKELSD